MSSLVPRDIILKKISPALIQRFEQEQKMKSSRECIRILIVEDQLFSQQLLRQVLSKGFDLKIASTAKEATHLFMETAPDIALLDIELAHDSGHNVARFIKSVDPSVFAVMITGSNLAIDVSTAKKNHVDGFILKPYNKGKILRCIESFYNAHPDKRPEG